MKIQNYENLKIWQSSIVIVKEIYTITRNTSFNQDFGIRDQIRRSSVSIPSNIAEGFERTSNNEFIRFLRIAKGSLGEVRTQLKIALMINYLGQNEYNKLEEDSIILTNQIGKLISYLAENKSKRKKIRKTTL